MIQGSEKKVIGADIYCLDPILVSGISEYRNPGFLYGITPSLTSANASFPITNRKRSK
jgi:hypothetical protein